MKVSALFIEAEGTYKGTALDLWPAARDARDYEGPNPVIAHPPCNLWVNLAAVNWARYGRQRPAWYPGGDDGGCFQSALKSVRTFGGVLEHPAFSHAWEFFHLSRPPKHGWLHIAGAEYVCEVWQSTYGHRARKRTWLLYVGPKPFELDWDRPTGSHQVGWFDRLKPTVSKKEASSTPAAFRDALIQLAILSSS